ncbi:VOC family protein [Vibrio sp. ZSDE26]|uniref:VOC family protein n=1 Tax=Vibrio amylolyticus TaxID=2847292 RepID=A0A9X2BH80_9VIBR|nr:VOC family protein [Vibrio amylolyticus]MCK6262670.1 VOC family protein [Vibrio amylolyticus]
MSQLLAKAELTPTQMKAKLNEFMQKIQLLSDILSLDLSEVQADHIALRINDSELAKLAHSEWQKEGKVISQARINGRPIIVLEFDEPLDALHWKIECLELPYPAEGKMYPEQSWEHVEFVIPSDATTAEEYLEYLKVTFPAFRKDYASLDSKGVSIKLSSPKGEGERVNNPTVAFKWQGVCIKLHPHTLKTIVQSELTGPDLDPSESGPF